MPGPLRPWMIAAALALAVVPWALLGRWSVQALAVPGGVEPSVPRTEPSAVVPRSLPEQDLPALVADSAAPLAVGQRARAGDVRFERATAALAPEAAPALDALAGALRRRPGLVVRIEGFTDGLGDPARNLALSTARAEAVRRALVARGVAPERLTVQGKGDMAPVASDATEDGRALNQRLEVVIVRP